MIKRLGSCPHSVIEALKCVKFPETNEKNYGYTEHGYVEIPKWINKLKETYCPLFNLVSVSVSIPSTSDVWKSEIDFETVMINFGKSTFQIQRGSTMISEELQDRDVIMYSSKLLHRFSQISDPHYIITFRKLKRNGNKES